MPRCRIVGLFVIAGALLLAAPAGVLAAPKPPPAIEVENLRIGFGSGGRSDLFKVGNWVPIWVQLRAGVERFRGQMEVVVADDDGTPTSFRQPVEVAAGASARFTTYARPGTSTPEFKFHLYREGRRRPSASFDGAELAKFDALPADEALLLTLGNPQGVDLVPGKLGLDRNRDSSPTPGQGSMAVARLDTASGLIPGRWYGYDGARAIVLDTNDRAALDALGSLRGQALIDWVRRGGHLVVAVSANWQQVKDGALAPILPAALAGQERIDDLSAIESFVGGTKPLLAPGGAAVQVAKLEGVEERGGKVLSAIGALPLVVRGAYGFGRVTIVGLDTDQRPFSQWPDRAAFWVKALDLHQRAADPAEGAAAMTPGGGGRLFQSGVTDLSTQLRQALEQFPGIELVSFGWVAFFIFLYILLIGPGDYFFLKKVVKRMELTWVTFPLIVVAVSALAYLSAYALKGNRLLVNKVDIVDVDQPGGVARGRTFIDVFSPQNRDYDVSVIPLPADGPTPAASETPARPPAGTEVLLSWFGVPEPGFGGMGGGGRMSFGGGYAYGPTGAAESLAGVRIPIWSTKCLAARWFGPAPTLIDADLRPVGSDRLAGTVANRLGYPLHDAILAFNKQVYLLGTVAPGATVRVELSRDRQLSGYLRSNLDKYLAGQPSSRQDFKISRPDLLLGLMFHDAATTSTFETPLASAPLHDLDLSGQLALDRPMLMARVEHPATRLVLGRAPRTPEIDETTMLRVILPLGKAEGGPAPESESVPR